MESSVGVYVHVPFCERVCPYCDFAVMPLRRLPAGSPSRYVDALVAELALRRHAFADRALESLYFGGGTPSLLEPAQLARLVEAVRAAFPAEGPVEITLEVNPSTLERARLPAFAGAGVNRVSVGVQSFEDPILKRLGRAHRAEEARRTLRACRLAGFDALCLDLIFAAPGQTLAGFAADLEEALVFAPEHVSAYELTIEPGTPFAVAARRGQLALPGEEEVLAMLELAQARLAAAGLVRYELSNYARPGREAVHNRRYWERRPVLGLGVGAVSNDPPSADARFGVRRANLRSLPGYLERLGSGRSPEAGAPEVLDARTARGEALFLALRTARGLDAGRFAEEFGAPPRAYFGAAIAELRCAGLLEESEAGDLRLTPRGSRLADSVSAHFV